MYAADKEPSAHCRSVFLPHSSGRDSVTATKVSHSSPTLTVCKSEPRGASRKFSLHQIQGPRTAASAAPSNESLLLHSNPLERRYSSGEGKSSLRLNSSGGSYSLSSSLRFTSASADSDGSLGVHDADFPSLASLFAHNVPLMDEFLTSSYWDHPMIELRGVALLHFFLYTHVNATNLLKLATTIEMMQASRSFRCAVSIAFRTDSPAVQVVGEMWRLVFDEKLGAFDDHVASLLRSYCTTPVEIDPLRVPKLDASCDPEAFCKQSVAFLMRHADSALSFILQVLDVEAQRIGSSMLAESLNLVLYIASKFVHADAAVQIVASMLFLRVISPRFLALASTFDDDSRPRAMRGAVLLGRILQSAANGAKEFAWPKLNVLVDVLHSLIHRRIRAVQQRTVRELSCSSLPSRHSACPLHWEAAVSMIRTFLSCEEARPLLPIHNLSLEELGGEVLV